jgi:hypothetical protein
MAEGLAARKEADEALPKMVLLDTKGLGAHDAAAIEDLWKFTLDNNIVLIFDVADDVGSSSVIFKLMNKSPPGRAYKKNAFVLVDFTRLLKLPEGYPTNGLIYFNRAFEKPYLTAAGGSIASPSQAMQAGLVELLKELTPRYRDAGLSPLVLEEHELEAVRPLYEIAEPDPTISYSIFYFLRKKGMPGLFRNEKFSLLRELHAVFGKKITSKYALRVLDRAADPKRGGRAFEEVHAKAQAAGIWQAVKKIQNESVGEIDIFKANGRIVRLLKDAYQRKRLSKREIVLLEALVHIVCLHVGAPSFARRDFIKKALSDAAESTLTPEELEARLLKGEGDYIRRTYGLSYDSSEIASGFYGSKAAMQELVFAFKGKVSLFIPTPYYVGYDSMYLTMGVPPDHIIGIKTERENSYIPTPEELAGSIEGDRSDTTKIVMLTSPSNPASTVIGEAALKSLIKASMLKGAYVVLDLAYGALLF